MNLSELQALANLANAQKSTGPRSEAGKQKSSLNAMKHGLTGQVVVLPEDNMAAYNAHVDKITALRGAVTYEECLLAKNVADSYWRVERIKNIENGTFAVGHMSKLKVDTGNDKVNDLVSNTQVFHGESKGFSNMALYEQRILRARKQDEAALKEMIEARKAKEAKELEEAKLLAKLAWMENRDYDPKADGFVYSRQEIRAIIEREKRLEDAKHYQKVGWSRHNRPQSRSPWPPKAA